MIKDIKEGEIIFGDCKIQYKYKNRIYIEKLYDQIISRKYNSNFPKINNNELIVSKLKNIKKKSELKEIIYINIKIKVRTGYIMKYKKDKKYNTVKIEKQTRLSNGTYI
mgnify:CR=1 FL=1|tara:strand:- start:73 stop:399 length:327 start_codon:yes stop_codon:yes gene_type:complete